MNPNKLLNAIGEIDDRLIEDAYARHRIIPLTKRLVALAAVLALTMALGVSALAAADVYPAYDFLYRLSQALAQRLKPVQMVCVDNGIEMQVISADVSGSEADVLISLRDLEGHRVDATTDLFDSYMIRTPSSLEGSCGLLDYDGESETATFLVHLAQSDGRRIDGEKITFSMSCFLSGKQAVEGLLPLNLSEAELNPQTQTDVELSGDADSDFDTFLVPGGLLTPVNNVRITAMGVIDEKLHIQAHFADTLTTDAHGEIYLSDGANERLEAAAEFSFDDADRTGHYKEFIFDVSPAQLEGYQIYGWFESGEGFYTGDWQVTFAL